MFFIPDKKSSCLDRMMYTNYYINSIYIDFRRVNNFMMLYDISARRRI